MKLKNLYILLLLILPSISFSQTKGRVVYKVISESLVINENSATKNGFAFINKRLELRASIPLNLDFDNHESLFYADSQTNVGHSLDRGYKSAVQSFNLYYRNEDTKEAIEQVISERTYLVESKTSDVVWEITKEQKTIGGYLCFKATTSVLAHSRLEGVYEKTLEAWFAPSIPLKLGPMNLGGLPGLILELVDGDSTYYVESMDLDPDFEIEVKKPTRGKTVSWEEYYGKRPIITRDNFKQLIGG